MAKVRVGVVFGFPFGDGGGLDRAVCAIINALNAGGFAVQLVTFGTPDLTALERLYGFKLDVERVWGDSLFYRLPGLLRVPVCTSIALVHTMKMAKTVRLVFCVGGRFEPTRFIPYSRRKTMCYQISPRWKPVPAVLAENDNVVRKVYRILWDSTWPWPLGPSKDDFVIIHNSYAKNLIERDFGLSAKMIIGLPASEVRGNACEKEKKVVHFGRFHPEKRHEAAVEIMALVRTKCPDAKFCLVGLTNLPQIASRVLKGLEEMIDQRGLRGSIEIRKDLPFDELVEVLGSSKVIMSMQLGPETYTMTLIESMAMGCVPVIPKVAGGAWEDILDYGKYGFGFETDGEGAAIIARLLSLSEAEFQAYSNLSEERAAFFAPEAFSKRLTQTIDNFLKAVHHN